MLNVVYAMCRIFFPCRVDQLWVVMLNVVAPHFPPRPFHMCVFSHLWGCSSKVLDGEVVVVVAAVANIGWEWIGNKVPLHFIYMPLNRLAVLSSWLSSSWFFLNLPFHRLVISSISYFTNLPFHQIYPFIILLFKQLDILSTCSFVNLQFCQPIKKTKFTWTKLGNTNLELAAFVL